VPAIESDPLDAGRGRLFGERLANFGGSVTVPAAADIRPHTLVTCAGADDRFTRNVVNELATEVLQRAMNAESWMLRGSTQPIANVVATPLSFLLNAFVFVHLTTDRL
jgi:hypothetical protein